MNIREKYEQEEREREATIKALYSEGRKYALMLGLRACVHAETPGDMDYREGFIMTLGTLMFELNNEIDPSTELVTDSLTPEMVDWYYRELTFSHG